MKPLATRYNETGVRVLTREQVWQIRHELGMTRRQFANLLNLSDASGEDRVKDWEDGRKECAGPTVVAIEQLLAKHKHDQALAIWIAGASDETLPQKE